MVNPSQLINHQFNSICFCLVFSLPFLDPYYPATIPNSLFWTVHSLWWFIIIVGVIWFCFSKYWRNSSTFCHRARYPISAKLFTPVLFSEYLLLSLAFVVLPLDFQWILAIILPLTREIGSLLLVKISTNIAGRNDQTG